jgi:hypothetical protein
MTFRTKSVLQAIGQCRSPEMAHRRLLALTYPAGGAAHFIPWRGGAERARRIPFYSRPTRGCAAISMVLAPLRAPS